VREESQRCALYLQLGPLCLLGVLAVPVFGASATDWENWEKCRLAESVDVRIAARRKRLQAEKESIQNSAETYEARGEAYFAAGDFDRAIADYSEAIRLDPEPITYLIQRSNTYWVLRNYKGEVADCTEIIKLQRLEGRKATYTYGIRGSAYFAIGDYDHAIADYTEAIRFDAKNTSAYVNRSNLALRLGENGRAIADLTEAIRIDPTRSSYYYYRGRAYEYTQTDDLSPAIADYTEAIRLDPKLAVAYWARGISDFCAGSIARGTV
jgi:tetratricopeptide (TPR) repeat protein